MSDSSPSVFTEARALLDVARLEMLVARADLVGGLTSTVWELLHFLAPEEV
ncbi:hypothetical protein N5A93_18120 [Roseovarius sp. EGI FJ00037]|uniref:hypothetical protein n=1 Tax=Roseovarius salincola TaxID=2978479 RepID=UPI0022A81EB1|nr:hypothetical protein [Roseovarius sp. EGI FJ00037]MCZ0814142.1 hypothetical protein [Roseovarius sp. EGI FJ00037]